MSDVDFQDDQTDEAFEAELNDAREEQSGEIEEAGEGDTEQEEAKTVSKDVEKLERIAADKSRMAHSERRRAREAEERNRELEARLARLEGGSKIEDDPFDLSKAPDPVQDPIGALEFQQRAIAAYAKRVQEEQRQGQQQTAQERQFQQINTRMTEHEADFRELNPDYDDAAKHFREARTLELQEQGYEGDELTQALRTELVGLVARTLQSGKDPAEVVYKLAKNRGFGTQARKEVVDTPSKKLQTIERGQKASRSLSTMSGKTGDGELSVESINKLDGAAFDAAYAKMREQAKRRA